MIYIVLAAVAVFLWAKNKQDEQNKPVDSPTSGISHLFAYKFGMKVTERQPPWGDTTQYNFAKTVDPSLPTGTGSASSGAAGFAVPVSQLRFPAGIAKSSGSGGGGVF